MCLKAETPPRTGPVCPRCGRTHPNPYGNALHPSESGPVLSLKSLHDFVLCCQVYLCHQQHPHCFLHFDYNKRQCFPQCYFLALATYQSLYPLTLFVPGLLYLLQRQYIPVKMKSKAFWIFSWEYAMMYVGSLVVIVCLSFFLLSSWDFIPAVYGFYTFCSRSHSKHWSFLVLLCRDV